MRLGYGSEQEYINAGGGTAGIPAAAATTAATTPAVTSSFAPGKLAFKDYYVGDSPSAAQLAYGKAMGVDPRMYGITAYAADGGRIGYAGGGIAGLRQGYFLGKLVKKVTRGIKKVAKSPIGKMALMAGLYNFGPQLLAKEGFSFKGGFKDLISKGIFKKGSNISPFKAITALSSLPFLMGDDEREQYGAEGQYRGEGIDIPGIRKAILSGNYDPLDYPYVPAVAKDGGRIGLAEGLTPRQAALKSLPEYKTFNEDDEEQKLSLGGSAGLPPVTQQTEGMYSQSFGDDETPMPTQPDQMPRPRPMMNPMMGRQMNPMMARGMNPMMSMQPRMMANEGGIMMASAPDPMDEAFQMYKDAIEKGLFNGTFDDFLEKIDEMRDYDKTSAVPRMMAQEGGLMDMGGMEKDYRNEGGFVPIGGQERADDVPARLSKNEFVFTADAVRNAGGGDIDKGAEIMENMMENLEAGGKVSEESQGLEGARAMFATQKRLGEVL
jgi:hypothetical protein